ncbi:hypothetical protein [Flyfo microvirus Tbat2_93]|nr:hypothetical protein [Flyfo microvirus Tbat2_93]
MSSYKRRQERREKARANAGLAPVSTPERVPMVTQRSRATVAMANRVAAAALPDLLTQKPVRRRTSKVAQLAATERQATISQGEAKRSPSGSKRAPLKAVSPERPSLAEKPVDGVKCRPKSNKPKGGGGKSRDFVPWDSNCST